VQLRVVGFKFLCWCVALPVGFGMALMVVILVVVCGVILGVVEGVGSGLDDGSLVCCCGVA